MKTFKFSVYETWFGGTNPERIVEIKARTEASAWKKITQLKGNRDWEIILKVVV